MIGAAVRRRDQAMIAGLVVCAGTGLWLWGASPAARWLDHGSAPPGTGPVVTVVIFIVAWLLMTVATMLPTTVPLLDAFARVTAARPGRGALTGAVVAGFLAVWTCAGLVAAVADLSLRDLLHRSAWHAHAPLAMAAALALAGLYQLSGLAARCRGVCRSPRGFLIRHWTGAADVVRQSVVIGADYGRSCLGCCAPLMIVMLAIGMGNLAWMYLLALVAALQKHGRWGESVATLVGVALLVAALAVAVQHVAV